MPTFLIEFDSAQAAFAYLGSATSLRTVFSEIVLISPAAQEYLEPAQPARDPDLMPPAPAAVVTLPPWKLLVQSSEQISGVMAQELARSAEKDFWNSLEKFGREVVKRHKNAMILRCNLPAQQWEELITSAAVSASNYSFINPAIAEKQHVTFAFVPLSVDPPAAMHYAQVVSQLSSKFGAARLEVVASPGEVIPYLHVPLRAKFSSVIETIKRTLWRRST